MSFVIFGFKNIENLCFFWLEMRLIGTLDRKALVYENVYPK